MAELFYIQGDYSRAQSVYDDCLRKRDEVLGAKHPDTLLSLNNLAELYYKQGDYSRAQSVYEDCLRKREEVLGAKHPDTLLSRENLAELYYKQGDYSQAQLLYDCSLYERLTKTEAYQMSSSIPFPKHGVKVSFLNKFVETYCGGRNKIQGWTTTDVNDKIVKPVSAASKSSFCEFLKSTDESSSVETAVVFISHGKYSRKYFHGFLFFFSRKINSILFFSVAWLYEFLDVVNAIQYHFRNAPETIIWFDLFRFVQLEIFVSSHI